MGVGLYVGRSTGKLPAAEDDMHFKWIRMIAFLLAIPALAGCGEAATPLPSTAAPASSPSPAPTPTEAYPTPDLSRRPLVWFGPLPPMEQHAGRPFIGAPDFMQLFTPDAPWQEAAGHVQVFKMFGEWISEDATAAELKQAFADLKRRGIAVDVDEGPLTAPAECGQAVEGFAGIREGLRSAQRVKAAGGKIDLIDMDEPFAFASIYPGPNACHWDATEVAERVSAYVHAMQAEFPGVIVGTSEPFWKDMHVEQLQDYIETYKKVSGAYFPFFHFDPDYGRPDWPEAAKEMEDFCRARGIAFGIYYVGSGADTSDEAWLGRAGERVKTYELEHNGRPDHVIFQSWNDHPDRTLPETEAYTFTNIVDTYVRDKSALGMRTSGPGANLTYEATVTASRYGKGYEPALAVDGNPDTWWGATAPAPQWIQIQLRAPATIAAIRLSISQSPPGQTLHRIRVKGPDTGGRFVVLGELSGITSDLQVLTFTPPEPVPNVEFIRIDTLSSPSWVAWREIEVLSP